MFDKLYSHYKDNWDYEMRLRKANMTYKQAEKKARRQEEWVPAEPGGTTRLAREKIKAN